MRNKYIKFCNIHNISDGVLREFLFKEKKQACLETIQTAIKKSKKKIIVLKALSNIVTYSMKKS